MKNNVLRLTCCLLSAFALIFLSCCEGEAPVFHSLYTIESISKLKATGEARIGENTDESVYVFLFDQDKIGISQTPPKREMVLPTTEYYFVGLNLGEFDGWVARAKYELYLTDTDPEVILRETCLGVVSSRDTADRYLVTGNPFDWAEYGKIYHRETKNGVPELVMLYEMDVCPDGFAVGEKGVLYLVAEDRILSVNPDGEVTVLHTSAWLGEQCPNSLCVLDGTVYIGINGGVAVYDIVQDSLMWYEIALS